jgi:hypothetical protein
MPLLLLHPLLLLLSLVNIQLLKRTVVLQRPMLLLIQDGRLGLRG